MNKLMKFSGIVSTGLLLAACQDAQSSSTKEQASSETNSQERTKPAVVTINGIADHYHTGDEVELTAVTDEETTLEDWQWYIKESETSNWEAVSGMTSNVFSREATANGLQVKAELQSENDETVAESEAVEVLIDDHGANDEVGRRIYNGFFYNDEIKERTLSDWEGDWQSVYPYLISGDLDEVFEEKASNSDTMNAEEYKEYYTEGYSTDVDRIVLEDDSFTFYFENGDEATAEYESDGHEILNYERGNRGVRYVFNRTVGSEDMPQYIQFSDHDISSVKSHHYHLYWGDDREALLEEVVNWPTYYPSEMDKEDIVRDMLAH